MCFHVLIKVLFHVEVFATPLAHELFVPDVDAHVGTQLVLVLKPLITVLQQEKQQPMIFRHQGARQSWDSTQMDYVKE